MRVLVVGGTGSVGSQVVRQLMARGVNVHVLTRDANKAVPEGATAVVGNLAEPETVRRVFDGMDGVFLVNSVSATEAHEGLMGVCGAMEAGVRRLVYLSVHKLDAAPHLPHFGAKIGVEAAVAQSGLEYTILRPNNFYQNDYWLRDAIVHGGFYPQPLGNVGLSRVDTRDIAEAAAIVLAEGGHGGEIYDLVGPEPVTGESSAAAWSAALGRPVAYGGDDLDVWEAHASKLMPAYMAYDFRKMYEFFQAHGLLASDEAIARQTRLLGHPPRAYGDFVRATAAAWAEGA
jgi:uncharacterized protein YbjT (DUF2867 family)